MTGGSSEKTGYSRASSLKRTSCPRGFWRGTDDMMSCVSLVVQCVGEERTDREHPFVCSCLALSVVSLGYKFVYLPFTT